MCIRQYSGDISQRPSKVIRSELKKKRTKNLLNPKDLKNAAMSLYRLDVHEALDHLHLQTNESESFVLTNDVNSGVVIFSCNSK